MKIDFTTQLEGKQASSERILENNFKRDRGQIKNGKHGKNFRTASKYSITKNMRRGLEKHASPTAVVIQLAEEDGQTDKYTDR